MSYYQCLNHAQDKLTPEDRIAMRNEEQTWRLNRHIYLTMLDSELTPESKAQRIELLRSIFVPVPQDATEFLYHYGYVKATIIHGWVWSDTFSKWSALVTLENGWFGYTYPKPQPQPISKEVEEELRSLGLSD